MRVVLAVSLAAILLTGAGGPAASQDTASQEWEGVQRPLREGEVIVPLDGPCAIVVQTKGMTDAQRKSILAVYRQYKWTGKCYAGLAHGEGELYYGPNRAHTVTNWLFLGRQSPHLDYSFNTGIRGTGRRVSVRILGMSWSHEGSGVDWNAPPSALPWLARFDDGQTWARVLTTRCSTNRKPVTTMGGERFDRDSEKLVEQRCAPTRYRDQGAFGSIIWMTKADVHYVEYERKDAAGKRLEYWARPCPAVTSAVGCEAIWKEAMARIGDPAELRARAEAAHIAWQRELLDFYAPVVAAVEKREAAAAALATAKQEAEAAETARKAAEAEQVAAAFQQRLKTANAGQLFALADELREKGDSAGARAALRGLVERFPNSPLAATAAQQLAGMSGASASESAPAAGSSPAASGNAPAAGPSPAAGGGGGRSCQSLIGESTALVSEGSANLAAGASFEFNVWARQFYLQLANRLPACRQDANFMAMLRRELAQAQQFCRQMRATQCETGTDPRPAAIRQKVGPGIERIVAGAGSGAAPSSDSATTGCALTPDGEAKAHDAAMGVFIKRYPVPPASAGTRAQYQYAYFLTSEALKDVEQRRICLGARYATLKNGYETSRDSAKRSCGQVSVNLAACEPVYPR